MEKKDFSQKRCPDALEEKGIQSHPSSQDSQDLPGVTHQLEVGNSNGALLIHILLVFVLNQTLHQVPRVYLVICHILGKAVHIYISFPTISEQIVHPSS